MFDVAVTCLVLTAVLANVNQRFIGLPPVIGVMAIALLLSFAPVGLDYLGIEGLHNYEVSLLASIDFSNLLIQGMLSLLLFAGALHIDVGELRSYWWQVGVLAVLGTVVSTLLVGYALWYFLPLLGLGLPWVYCMVFGALISHRVSNFERRVLDYCCVIELRSIA